ncbi:hypothetical protein [Bradyrhizobium septentrionale]|uniref:Uncharacterized protein n=1 Tax=Bradyrhizobium septentrionale TaxID=1404411 RepID=A0ABZ2NRQ2_9BRAD
MKANPPLHSGGSVILFGDSQQQNACRNIRGIAMSNRHQRRADLRSFKREAHRAHLVTYMIAADDEVSLDRHPLLRRALEFWRGNIMQRRPFCPACKSNYADGALPGAFLFSATAVAPTNASVTAFCHQCSRDLDVVEREAARVLRSIIANGKWLDPR